jgi:hypothetical protein
VVLSAYPSETLHSRLILLRDTQGDQPTRLILFC